MMLVTVFGNKLNKRYFFFFLGWGKYGLYFLYMHAHMIIAICTFVGPAVPIVAISAAIAHEQYGTDY